MGNKLQIFQSPEFGEIRVSAVKGETYFVGADLATALGYSNTRDAIATHVHEDDKADVVIHDGSQRRKMIGVNESGLYALIFGSRLDTAKAFKRWVTHDILPALRKTGSYSVKSPATPTLASVNTAMKMLLPIMDDLGIKPQYKWSVMARAYQPAGLEIPLLGLPEAEPFIDPRGIARQIGVLSKNGHPHDKAVGAIIKKLDITEDEKETVPLMLDNGRMQPVTRYAPSVIEKVRDWIVNNNYPDVIQGDKQAYTVRYEMAEVTA